MRKIPFSPPDLSQAEIDEVIKVLKSGWITTGPETKLFESRIAERCHTEKAVCLSSQTSCAELTLRILGIGPGDEVIVPAYTYTATASIIYHVGAKPVMVDCKSGSFEMDYDKMEAAINHNTKVIIPVDLAGVVCDYDVFLRLLKERKAFSIHATSFRKSSAELLLWLTALTHSVRNGTVKCAVKLPTSQTSAFTL